MKLDPTKRYRRKHHNTKGTQQIKKGTTVEQVNKMALKLYSDTSSESFETRSITFRCTVEVGYWVSHNDFSGYKTIVLKGGEITPTMKYPLANFNIYKKELIRVFKECIEKLESEFPKFKVPKGR